MADSKTELSPTTSKKVFEEINERPVDDIQLELFYKPHTITLRECLTIIERNPLLHLFARKSFFPLQFCYAYLALLTQPLYVTQLLTTKATSSQVSCTKL